jgi:hypothetical protein
VLLPFHYWHPVLYRRKTWTPPQRENEFENRLVRMFALCTALSTVSLFWATWFEFPVRFLITLGHLFPLEFPTEILYAFLISDIHTTYIDFLILAGLFTPSIYDIYYKFKVSCCEIFYKLLYRVMCASSETFWNMLQCGLSLAQFARWWRFMTERAAVTLPVWRHVSPLIMLKAAEPNVSCTLFNWTPSDLQLFSFTARDAEFVAVGISELWKVCWWTFQIICLGFWSELIV